MAEMYYHKLSLTICDYEQLIPIDYIYNQFEINDMWLARTTSYGKVAHT